MPFQIWAHILNIFVRSIEDVCAVTCRAKAIWISLLMKIKNEREWRRTSKWREWRLTAIHFFFRVFVIKTRQHSVEISHRYLFSVLSAWDLLIVHVFKHDIATHAFKELSTYVHTPCVNYSPLNCQVLKS